mmetsp:Transcript_5802/g.19781  ORF Transcript_5802/g.19781 Transcript_5802/m.19781 type:complete len:112 (-) Transcript_5802:1023-1358(-)
MRNKKGSISIACTINLMFISRASLSMIQSSDSSYMPITESRLHSKCSNLTEIKLLLLPPRFASAVHPQFLPHPSLSMQPCSLTQQPSEHHCSDLPFLGPHLDLNLCAEVHF